jgi:hypothetical protein
VTTEPEEREPRDCAENDADGIAATHETEAQQWDRETLSTEKFLNRERHRESNFHPPKTTK